jgi:VWFA-related protein
MFKHQTATLLSVRVRNLIQLCAMASLALLLGAAAPTGASGQALERDFDSQEKPLVSIRNHNGRVVVIATDDQKKKISFKAESTGTQVSDADIRKTPNREWIEFDVKARSERDRIDVTFRVPSGSRVRVESDFGAVDVIGKFLLAEVVTNTGTIRADVPLDAIRLDWIWQASRPRTFSDVVLPEIKEKAGGVFVIKGQLGNKDARKEDCISLNFTTQRGVILFNVDPSMVPSDLTPRALTEAAKAIVRSGNPDLSEAVRKLSPKMFGEYVDKLPDRLAQPTLRDTRPPTEVATAVAPQLMRLTASVTDLNGRAIAGLGAKDFTVFENGEQRKIESVATSTTPFNLVILLDVSGSVEERLDFIRKAARNFIATVSPQDRIAILSFHNDVQVISNFTTDRNLLAKRVDDIDAGGATALYDAIAYALVDTLKPLRGERTAVVVMSDGDDNKSFVPFGALLKATVESGALIYPLYIPSGLIPLDTVPVPSTTLDPTRTRYLTLTTRAEEEGKKLASVSGGVYYPIHRIEDLQKAYDDVVNQLRMAYTITYSTTASTNGNGSHRVRLRTNREGASIRISPAVSAAP